MTKYKIAIVGADETKWTEEQKQFAKSTIELILYNAKEKTLLSNGDMQVVDFGKKVGKSLNVGTWRDIPDIIRDKTEVLWKEQDITLVSGHCPKGGVDIWAEEIADIIGIKKLIFEPEINRWEDKTVVGINLINLRNEVFSEQETELMGYKSRNKLIAKTCDILYCIVPESNKYKTYYYHDLSGNYLEECRHCKLQGHPTNGGCWTMKYAKKLGKETHLIIIKS